MLKEEKRTICILGVQIFFLLFCFVILPGTLYLIGRSRFSEKKMYEATWNISLPDQMELLYDEHTPRGFHGDGIRHTIYKVEREKIDLNFIVGDNPEMKSFCITICDNLETEEEYVPDFEGKYGWIKYEKKSNMLIMVYFPDLQQLHFFQKLI